MRILVVDDEPLARDKLCGWLRAETDIEEIVECANGFEALEALAAGRIDLLFLDIKMPEMDGFQLLAKVEDRPLVVFVTAYDRYAIAAFEEHALDYLLKPYDRARFAVALDRARRQHLQNQRSQMGARIEQLLTAAPKHYESRFAVRRKDDILLVEADQVDWIEAQGNYVALHLGKTQHLIRDSLGDIEKRVDPQSFLRIHRSAMVNIARISALRSAAHGDYTVVLHDGRELALSRTYAAQARQRLRLSF